jgi:hypothetical protein
VCYYEEETGIFCFFFPSQLFRVCSFDFVFVVKSAECSVAVYLKRSLAPKCQVSLSLSALCCSALFFFPEKVLDNKQQKSVTTKKQKKYIYYVYDDDDVSSVHADDVDDVLQKTEKDYCDDVRIVVQ